MRKQLTLLLLCMLLPTWIHAQSLIMGDYIPSDPQVWSFIKYGGQTPDLYTGTVRAEIPIYTYKDPDFEIPIALSYSSNGYMPNMQANFVGLGWTLIAGGTVTRRVNLIKDEGFTQRPGIPNINQLGFYRYSVINTEPDISMRTPSLSAAFGYFLGNKSYESEPDLFFFRMPGHSGRFMINEVGGTASVFDATHPFGEYAVDLTGLQQSVFVSRISITSGDGYEYVFGGADVYGCYIKNQISNERDGMQSSEELDPWSDSWHLTQIIAPNGRRVVYNYTYDMASLVDQNCHPYCSRLINTRAKVDIDGMLSSSDYTHVTDFSVGKIFRTTPVARLDSIVVVDQDGETEVCRIEFSYSTREKERMRFTGGLETELLNPGRLTAIVVKGPDGGILRQCTLSYRYTGNTSTPGNQVLLLKEANIIGEGKYSMTYYNQDTAFPLHGCSSVDHWGYWNNATPSYDSQALLPSVSVNETTNEETIVGNTREPNSSVAISGMLQKMTYPTGGWTMFEYEAQQYHRHIVKNGTEYSKGKPVLITDQEDIIAGGLRIKRITDYANASDALTKEYLYTDGDFHSSGLLYHTPRYNNTYILRYNYPALHAQYYCEDKTGIPAYMLDGTSIGYSRVAEKFTDESQKEYLYSDYEDYQDDTQYDTVFWNTAFEWMGNGVRHSTPNYIYQYLRDAQSLSRSRGKLKEVNVFDHNETLTSKTEYQYSLASMKSKKISCLKTDIDSIYVFHHYVGDYPLTEETRTSYGSGQAVTTTFSYSYNSLGQLKTRTMGTTDGATYRDDYLYVIDMPNRTAAQDTMISRNMVAPLISKTSAVHKPGTTGMRLIDGTKQGYSLFTIMGRKLPIMSSLSKALVSPAVYYSTPYALSWKTHATVSAVDRYGRPTEIKDANGIYTTYFWGYGGMYLAGRFENCRISDLNQRYHAGFEHFDAGWTGISDSNAAAFRNFPDVRFTCWKYKPYVGVTEMTDPSGRKTIYTYNSHGHLTGIIGPDGNKISEYEYSVDR